MKIKVLARYTNPARRIDVYPDDEIEVNDGLAEFLSNDAPGCFDIPGQKQPEPQPNPDAQREADAILDQAKQILAEAQDEAERIRAQAHAAASQSQKPFDLPPDGTTVKTDSTPPVVTGPDSGVEVTHVATDEERQKAEEEEAERQKALDKAPKDKMVKETKTK